MLPVLFALAQDPEPLPEPARTAPAQPAPAKPTFVEPPPDPPRQRPTEMEDEAPPRMSEGRMLVSAYNSGFQLNISPGVVIVNGEAGFALGARVGYGIDVDSVILVPGVRISAYFTDPQVYVGMPTFKLVLPLDRFAPFVEVGGGVGTVTEPSKTGFAWQVGGGFMVHFRHFALGAEVSYQAITGTGFKGIGFGPIIAFGY